MRVAIDATVLSDEGSARRGLGRYVRALLDDLPGVEGVQVDPLTVRPSRLVPPRLQWYAHLARIGTAAVRDHPDVFHSPCGDPPLRYPGPWVQTVHDLIPLVMPDVDWGLDAPRWRRRARLIRRASAVVCVSAHTAELAVRHLGIDEKRVHVVHHGVRPLFRSSPRELPALPPYVLYVGAYGRNKGYREAFDVISRVADAGLPHQLRVVGGADREGRAAAAELRASCRHPERVVFDGHLDDDELLARYHGAAALVVTSRYEGFGWPVVEAFACGVPVVAFANSSLPEVVGDGGVLVPDGDTAAFASVCLDLLRDDGMRAALHERALVRSRAFDPAACAAAHVEIYRSVA